MFPFVCPVLRQFAPFVTDTQCHICVDKGKDASYFALMKWDEEIDAMGLLCPLPVLKARKRLKTMAEGSILRLISDDPAAVIDVPHFCSESGNQLVHVEDLADCRAYLIRKSG